MWFRSWRRSHKWPAIDLYRRGGRSDIKQISATELALLMRRADEREWSAVGRPRWVREHADRIDHVHLVIFDREGASAYRCIAIVLLDDGGGGRFTVDVAIDEFDRAADVTAQRLVELAHRHLASVPMLPLEPEQEEAWRRLSEPNSG
jgi:hypothetical protein